MADAAQAVESIEVDDATVGCDGGGGPLGHPMVYLNLGPEGVVDCPYCSRRFLRRKDAAADH